LRCQRDFSKGIDRIDSIDEHQCLPGRLAGIDVANVVLFLGAADSRVMTAQECVVDAGWT